jgi:hypothetical protein
MNLKKEKKRREKERKKDRKSLVNIFFLVSFIAIS